jgi:hypothetical protein
MLFLRPGHWVPSAGSENRSRASRADHKNLRQSVSSLTSTALPEPDVTHRDDEVGAGLFCVKIYADSDVISV